MQDTLQGCTHAFYSWMFNVDVSVFVPLQWMAVQTGQWTTWSTGCCRVSRCGWSVRCSMVISGLITARHRVWASVSCGTAALAWATATSRSPSPSTACAWARRRMLSGSDQPTSRMQASTPASYGRTVLGVGGFTLMLFISNYAVSSNIVKKDCLARNFVCVCVCSWGRGCLIKLSQEISNRHSKCCEIFPHTFLNIWPEPLP